MGTIATQIGKRVNTKKIVKAINTGVTAIVNSIDTQRIIQVTKNSINKEQILKNATVVRDKSIQIIEEKVPIYPKSATAISLFSGFTFKGLVYSPEECNINTVKKALELHN